jgi:hypothetical protein
MRMPRVTAGFITAIAIAALSCRGATDTSPLTTGLTGIVTRGPITPVCMVNVACEAPFAAHFTVRRGSSTVAAFESDAAGAFEVRLAPGNYSVVPGADAPVISPGAQVKPVTVGPSGLTVVQLSFDTGIR